MLKNVVFLRICAAIIIFMVNVELTITSLAIVRISNHFHIDSAHLHWVNSIYLLSFSAFLIVSGKLADKYGDRTMTMLAMGLFILTSLVIGTTNIPAVLYIGRFIQGGASAALFSAATVLLFRAYPRERVAMVKGITGFAAGSAQVLGPLAGGIILTYLSWRFVFFVHIPLGLLVIFYIYVYTQHIEPPMRKQKIPIFRAVFFAVGTVMFTYGINHIATELKLEPITMAILLAAILILSVLFWIEARTRHPLIELKLLKQRMCLIANCIRFFIQGFAFFYYFGLAILAQRGLGFTPMQASLFFIGPGLFLAISSLLGSKLVFRYGYKIIITLGAMVIALSCFLLSLVSKHDLLLYMIIFNSTLLFGIGAMNASLSTYVLKEADPKQVGAANGLISTFAFSGAAIVLMLANAVMVLKAKTAIIAFAKEIPFDLTPLQLKTAIHVTRGTEPLSSISKHFTTEQVDTVHFLVRSALTAGYAQAMLFLAFVGAGVVAVSLFIKNKKA